jgi:uncharacterized protein YoxC
MFSTGFALWSLVVLFLLLVCGMIPAFVQIRRTARQAEEFLKIVQLELRPVLINMKELIWNLNRASEQVTGGMEKVGGTLDAIQEAGQTVRSANRLIRYAVVPKLITSAAVMTGVRVGLRTLVARLIGRR